MEPVAHWVRTSDGRRLSTFVWGAGADVVVFEAGLGASGRYWGSVARLLAGQARAVAYDRAGYGTSTTDQGLRTLDRLAQDLVAVVEAQAPVQRLVLVGHSWGGPVVRRAVQIMPPERVVGIVLVDPAEETAPVYFTRSAIFADRMQELLLPPLARSGLLRRVLKLSMRAHLPPEDNDVVVGASSSPTAANATIAENRQVRAGLLQLRGQASPPRVPTTVISGTKGLRWSKTRAQLVDAHRRSVEGHPAGRWVEAPRSRHFVLLTEPNVVAEEVARALRRA